MDPTETKSCLEEELMPEAVAHHKDNISSLLTRPDIKSSRDMIRRHHRVADHSQNTSQQIKPETTEFPYLCCYLFSLHYSVLAPFD